MNEWIWLAFRTWMMGHEKSTCWHFYCEYIAVNKTCHRCDTVVPQMCSTIRTTLIVLHQKRSECIVSSVVMIFELLLLHSGSKDAFVCNPVYYYMRKWFHSSQLYPAFFFKELWAAYRGLFPFLSVQPLCEFLVRLRNSASCKFSIMFTTPSLWNREQFFMVKIWNGFGAFHTDST